MDRTTLRLCTAPATFTRMLNEVLRPLYAKYPPASSVTTMDDCIIMTGPGEDDLHEEIAHMFLRLVGTNIPCLSSRLSANSSSTAHGLLGHSRTNEAS